jgi:hypothetical protein
MFGDDWSEAHFVAFNMLWLAAFVLAGLGDSISRIHNNCFCVDSKTHFVDLGEHFFTRIVETDIKFVLAFPTLNCRLDRHQLNPVLLVRNQRQRTARPRPKCRQSSPKINVSQSRKAPQRNLGETITRMLHHLAPGSLFATRIAIGA